MGLKERLAGGTFIAAISQLFTVPILSVILISGRISWLGILLGWGLVTYFEFSGLR